LTLRNSSHLL